MVTSHEIKRYLFLGRKDMKNLESILKSRDITLPASLAKSVLKEINPEYSLEAAAEAPMLWPPDVKSLLIGKDPVPGKD